MECEKKKETCIERLVDDDGAEKMEIIIRIKYDAVAL